MSPEDAARAARCAAKSAEVERLHAELAESERVRLVETRALEETRLRVQQEVTALQSAMSTEEHEGLHMAAHVATQRVQLKAN